MGNASILLGVMISPHSRTSHSRWEEWRRLHGHDRVQVVYVVGSSPPPSFGQTLRVEAREGLDHVGKVTEKSAAWWQLPGDDVWRCKSDDDTLVHIPRLVNALGRLDATKPTLFGYVKWRGWEVGSFRACGGVWGTAVDVWRAFDDGTCPTASGPFPYTAGAFYCMSAPARKLLREDAEFAAFLHLARRRNVDPARRPCRSAFACARAERRHRMWHHEDAGIGMNLFRAVVRANASLAVVATPGHYNDPFAIEQSSSDADQFWSARALWVHGVKRSALYERARASWRTERRVELPPLVCVAPRDDRRSRWDRARLPCETCATNNSCTEAAALCEVDVAHHFSVCRWPWQRAT